MKPLGKPSLYNNQLKELVTNHQGAYRTKGEKEQVKAWKRAFKKRARQQDKKLTKEE